MGSAALIGRDAELGRLEERLDGAASGVPTLTVVAGEAGIGKTALTRRLAARARDRGGLVLWGECVPLGDGELPYAPIVAGLREILRTPAGAALRDAPGELGRLLPELATPGSAPAAASEFSQGRLFEQLLGLVRRLTDAAPLLLVIEDLHWADPATRDLLSFCVRNLRDERLAVVATYRTDEVDRRHPTRRLLVELLRRDGVTLLELPRLARPDVERLVERALGRPPPNELLDDVFHRSEGNPFFAEELVAARDAQLPSGLSDALLHRVDHLSEGAVTVVRVLAAARRPVGGAILGAATALDGSGLAGALREATAAHVLVAGDGTYGFRHALVREAVYADLLPDERIALHHGLAEALELQGAGDPAELALHWNAAGDAAAAVTASVHAGRAAAHVFAFEQALAHFERALSLWDVGRPGEDRVHVLAEAADAARLTGGYERAVALCRQALELVDAGADPIRAAELHERLGDAHFVDDDAALAAYREALELLDETRTADRARLMAAEGRVLTYLLRWEEARDRCREALRLAELADARADQARARMTLGVALAFLGDTEPGEAHLRQALAIAEQEGRPDDLARVHLSLAEVLRLQGRFGDALTVMVEGCEAASRLGMRGSFGRFMSVNAAEDLFRLGRWDEAAERLETSARLSLRLAAEVLQHSVTAQLHVARGQVDAAREHLGRALALCEDGVAPEFLPGVYAAAAELALWDGRPRDAVTDVARGLDAIGTHADPLNTPVLYALGVRAHADLAQHARDEAARGAASAADALITGLEQLLARHSASATPPEAQAHLAVCHAERRRLTGEPDAPLWAATAEAWDALSEPYPAAYARWRLAQAALPGGSREEGIGALRVANETARVLRAAPLGERIAALARAARVDLAPAPTRTPQVQAPAGLSARELEVLELLAEGLTNRQIAARLYISDRTAGVHVSNILSKLGARNRVMAAGIALQLGLVSSRS